MPHLTPDPLLENLSRELALRAGCPGLSQTLSVCWNRRLRTTAGLACYQSKRIFLNPRLIEISAAEVQQTLRHELAHLVAQTRAGRRHIAPHGPEWRQACRDLGIPQESRCHNLPFRSRRMPLRYFYQCKECGSVLARVHPIKQQVACLRCCRQHNSGHYHERFRFVMVPDSQPMAA